MWYSETTSGLKCHYDTVKAENEIDLISYWKKHAASKRHLLKDAVSITSNQIIDKIKGNLSYLVSKMISCIYYATLL